MSQKLEQEEKRLSISSPADWIEENIYIPETKDDPVLQGRFELQPYQRDCLNEALSKDENGLFKYSIIIWSDIKKSAKSTIAAAIALYMAEQPWAECYLIANDLKQADSRVAYYARRAIQLSPTLKDKYRTRGYSIIGNNGSRIEALPIDPEGESGSNAELIQYSELWGAQDDAKSRMWCFDEETEILTRRGWLRYDEMAMDDEIATVVPETHELQWDKPLGINRTHYKGKMHYYGSKGDRIRFSKLVTPGHRLYGVFSHNSKNNKYAKRGVMRSNELRESGYRVYFPLTSPASYPYTKDKSSKISFPSTKFKPTFEISWMDYCKFMGIYLADGCTSRHSKTGQPVKVRITQNAVSNKEKYEKIKSLFERMFPEIGYSSYEYKKERKGNVDLIVHSSVFAEHLIGLGKAHTKYIPKEIKDSSPDCLEAFLDWYIMGDGQRVSKSSRSITTASKRMANDLQEIALKLGFYATMKDNAGNGNWRIRISDGKDGYAKEIDSRYSWGETDYDGIVWCPATRNGLVLARREYKPFVSGNTEMTLSPTKFGKSFRLIESYAGYMEESLILYGLWEQGVENGELLWPGRLYDVIEGEPTVLEAYINPEARMFCMWNTQPRCPWQTQEYYQSEAAILHPLEFERMHRNQWITQTTTFVPMEWWDACKHGDFPTIPENWPMAISLDAGTMKDNFGVLMCCRHPDRENHKDVTLVVYAKNWVPPKGSHGLDFQGTEEHPGPEMEVRRLIKENNVVVLAYDEYQLHDMVSKFRKEGIVYCRRFPQGSGKHSRTIADAALYDKIRERKIWHRGEADLRQHIQNANSKIDKEERMLRIVKRVEHLKVDLAVGLSMASYELFRLNL